MYDNDYIVLIDENGQPYIAHAKFIDKIKTAAGKFRYFYDADELKAYYDNLRGKASTAYNSAKTAVRRSVDRAKDRLGFDERDRMREARRRLSDVTERGDYIPTSNTKALQAYQKNVETAQNAVRRTTEEYANTPLGRLDAFLNRSSERARKAFDTISNYADTKLDEIADFTRSLPGRAKDFAKTVPGRAKEVASNVRTAASNAREAASNAIDKASDFYYDARATARDVGGRVKEAASDAVDWARNAPTNVSNTVANNRALAEYKKLDKMNPDDMTEEEYNRWIGYQFRFGSIK